MSVKTTRPEHEVAYQDLCALVNKHAATLTSLDQLAVGANMLGKLMALQDQRTTTPDMAIELVARNLELGNQQVLAQLANTRGSA